MNTKPDIVLVVDDNPDIRELVSRYVKKFTDCDVICANNGELAIREIVTNDIKLVLLDVMMPDFNGVQTVDAINKLYPKRDFRICMLTAKGDIKTVEQLVFKGVEDYLVKPIDQEILETKLKYLLADTLSLFKPPFATIKTHIYGTVFNERLTTIIMKELSEVHCRILVDKMVPLGHVMKVQFDRISRIIGAELYFYFKVIDFVPKKDDTYLLSGTFLAMDEKIREKLRQITIKGQGISDGN